MRLSFPKNIFTGNKRFWRIISAVSGGTALFYSLAVMLLKVAEVSGIYYETALRSFPGTAGTIVIAAIAGSAVMLLMRPWRSDGEKTLAVWERILRPAWLLWLIPATTFPGILIAVAVLSFIAFRSANEINVKLPEIPPKYLFLILTAGYLIWSAWGYFVQVKAFDSLYFIYGDWNQYAAHYSHLLNGDSRAIQWFSGAGHWNFGINLLMCAALKIWYAPDTIFLVNALVIASAIPLGGWLCCKCKLNSWTTLAILPIVVLNPVLSNQFLAHFYGFHPIVFVIPLFLGFFIAREYKCHWAMAVIFILSLLVQETVCVFWAGYAIYLLYRRQWKQGTVLFTAMVGLFFFLSKAVIPAAHSVEEYSQMFHYAQLGDNIGEVLISPLLRPKAFWGTLFERSAICFVFALLIPFLWSIVLQPALLITIIPLAAGVCLQNSAEFKSVLLWYGVEISAWAFGMTVVNWKNAESSVIGKWLNSPFPQKNLRRCAVSATVVSALFCGVLLAFIPGNKGPASRIMSRPDAGEMLDFITGAAGSFKRVIASSRLRGHFQFPFADGDIKTDFAPGDVIIIDLHDPLIDRPEDVEHLRQKIAADKRAVPVTFCIWENHTIVMFKILQQEVNLPPIPWLRQLPETEFSRSGTLLDIPVNFCKLRAFYHNGQMIYRAMLTEKTDQDIEFALLHKFPDGSNKEAVIRFGNGLFPAYTVKPGTVFEFAVPCSRPQSISGNIYKIQNRRHR